MSIGLFIKQFISFFIQPFGLICILLILSLYFLYKNKNLKAKVALSFSIFLLFLFSYAPVSNFLIENLESKYDKYDYKSDIKYIHVLGSGHNDDTSQSLSSQLSEAGLKRVLEGVIIYKRVANSKIIFTGAKGRASVSTALKNAQLAMALGVDKDDILLGGTAQDTKDESIFAKNIIGNTKFVLVTSATHMPRAMEIFHLQGLHPIAAPTDFRKVKINSFLIMPAVGSLVNSQIAIHEYIGLLWAKMKG